MLDALFGNLHLKVAALLAAIVAWLYVQSDELHIEPVQAKIEWTLAQGVVAVDPLPSHITLQVQGTRASIRRARRTDVSVVADLQNMGPGQHALEFAPMPVAGLPSGIEVRSHAPSGVRFELDRVATRRIEVEGVVVGTPSEGYAVDDVSVSPAAVSVKGARSKIDDLVSVRTEPIDVSGFTSGTEVQVKLDLPQGVEPAERVSVSATVDVVALNEQRTFAEVPVHVWANGPWRPGVPAAEVVLTGPAEDLRQLSPEDVVVFVHPPEGARTRADARFGEDGGARYRVLHGGGPAVQVERVKPDTIAVIPR